MAIIETPKYFVDAGSNVVDRKNVFVKNTPGRFARNANSAVAYPNHPGIVLPRKMHSAENAGWASETKNQRCGAFFMDH